MLLFSLYLLYFFFFNATPTTEIYTLSLHDALPIFRSRRLSLSRSGQGARRCGARERIEFLTGLNGHKGRGGCLSKDRKSTRLNSSHRCISYAVFCLKKKKDNKTHRSRLRT